MMLGRTVRVFKKKQVLGWLGIAAATVALICGLRFDVLGVQRYVPAQAELDSATLILRTNNYAGSDNLQAELDVTDPEVLSAVTELHRATYEAFDKSGAQSGYPMTVRYRLASGRTVTRKIPVDNVYAKKLSALLGRPEYEKQYYEAILPKALEDKTFFSLYHLSYRTDDNSEEDDKTRYFRDRDALQNAMLQDAAEGKLPIPIFNLEEDFDWQVDATDNQMMNGEMTILWLPSSAEHTLKLFGVKP